MKQVWRVCLVREKLFVQIFIAFVNITRVGGLGTFELAFCGGKSSKLMEKKCRAVIKKLFKYGFL
jgi:hypothetical protein